jgi:hypothetical protein
MGHDFDLASGREFQFSFGDALRRDRRVGGYNLSRCGLPRLKTHLGAVGHRVAVAILHQRRAHA